MTAAKKKPAEPVPPAPTVVVCAIDGCEEPVLHRGLCSAHWEDPRGRKG